MEHNVIYTVPYDNEVEYLESTGTQWFDSGVAVLNTTGIEIVAQKVVNNNADSFACGIKKDSKYFNIDVNHYNNNDNGILYVGFGDSQYKQVSRVHLSQFKVAVNVNNSRKVVFNDNTNIWNLPGDISVDGNIYVFASNGSSNRWRGRIYYLKIYDNTTLVRDFIPVRIGQIGYMYDKVSKKLFANKGTGNFILGQDVSNPVPNIRRVFRFGNKRFVMPMPYDSKVEYLETTGTQWLDTGYYGDINTAMECVCKVTDTTYGYVIAGSRTSATVGNISFLCGKFNNYYQYICDFDDYTNSRLLVKKSDVNDYVKLYTSANLRKAVDVVNETEYTNSYVISSTSQTPYTIKICHHDGNYAASYKHFRGRIKSFKLWSSDALLLDLIPVRRGNVGYMYDRVSGKLFANKGTGQFILGNDIND